MYFFKGQLKASLKIPSIFVGNSWSSDHAKVNPFAVFEKNSVNCIRDQGVLIMELHDFVTSASQTGFSITKQTHNTLNQAIMLHSNRHSMEVMESHINRYF